MDSQFAHQHVAECGNGQHVSRFTSEILPGNEDHSGAFRVHMLPPGPILNTNDGRRYILANGDDVAMRGKVPMAVDIDHRADFTGNTEACGWIESLSFDQETGLWATVVFTTHGAMLVKEKRYRYTSAVVIHDADGVITDVFGLSLTNRPAMDVQAIEAFSAKFSGMFPGKTEPRDAVAEVEMDAAQIKRDLLSRLGLPEDEEKAVAHVAQFSALNKQVDELVSQVSTLSKKADAAEQRAEEAEKRVEDEKRASFSREVSAFMDGAIKEMRIAPAERAYHEKRALEGEAQFAEVRQYIETRPAKLADAPASVPGEPSGEEGEGGVGHFSSAVVQRLRAAGLSDERIRKAAAVAPGRRGQEGGE